MSGRSRQWAWALVQILAVALVAAFAVACFTSGPVDSVFTVFVVAVALVFATPVIVIMALVRSRGERGPHPRGLPILVLGVLLAMAGVIVVQGARRSVIWPGRPVVAKEAIDVCRALDDATLNRYWPLGAVSHGDANVSLTQPDGKARIGCSWEPAAGQQTPFNLVDVSYSWTQPWFGISEVAAAHRSFAREGSWGQHQRALPGIGDGAFLDESDTTVRAVALVADTIVTVTVARPSSQSSAAAEEFLRNAVAHLELSSG